MNSNRQIIVVLLFFLFNTSKCKQHKHVKRRGEIISRQFPPTLPRGRAVRRRDTAVACGWSPPFLKLVTPNLPTNINYPYEDCLTQTFRETPYGHENFSPQH